MRGSSGPESSSPTLVGIRASFRRCSGFLSAIRICSLWKKKGGAQPEDHARAAKGAPLLYLLKQPKVWGLALGFGSYNYTFYLLLGWLPSYLSTALHIDLFHSVLYTSVPWLFAAVVDVSVGGLLVDTLVQRGWNSIRVRQAVLIGGTALGLG